MKESYHCADDNITTAVDLLSEGDVTIQGMIGSGGLDRAGTGTRDFASPDLTQHLLITVFWFMSHLEYRSALVHQMKSTLQLTKYQQTVRVLWEERMQGGGEGVFEVRPHTQDSDVTSTGVRERGQSQGSSEAHGVIACNTCKSFVSGNDHLVIYSIIWCKTFMSDLNSFTLSHVFSPSRKLMALCFLNGGYLLALFSSSLCRGRQVEQSVSQDSLRHNCCDSDLHPCSICGPCGTPTSDFRSIVPSGAATMKLCGTNISAL
ncbi:hypothetical protein J6590_044082 [Homalodisca vitripennis]|nr:hypothetical protein J6590_044082 [Homalodisca vitripennis]